MVRREMRVIVLTYTQLPTTAPSRAVLRPPFLCPAQRPTCSDRHRRYYLPRSQRGRRHRGLRRKGAKLSRSNTADRRFAGDMRHLIGSNGITSVLGNKDDPEAAEVGDDRRFPDRLGRQKFPGGLWG